MIKAKTKRRRATRSQVGSATNKSAGKETAESDIAVASEQRIISIAAAKEAGLRYVSPTSAGLSRRKAGNGFYYVNASGKRVSDAATLERIRALVLPPAWRDVWICSDPRGHLQAVGSDAAGRKQYRYHTEFRRVRDESKYSRMLEFVDVLPKIRRRIRADLKLPGMPREKVLAAVVHLLESTQVRVGNDEYARKNQSFGLTTLRNKHARVVGSRVQFNFRGKSGVEHAIDLNDKHLAQIIRSCQELPGEELFTYLDENGNPRDVGSADVNEYLREITGQDFTAKDFRTWAGTVLAAEALQQALAADKEGKLSTATKKKHVVLAIDQVAAQLRNTRAVCRKCYIHPAVIESYLDGSFVACLASKTTKIVRTRGLKVYEVAVVALVRQAVRRAA